MAQDDREARKQRIFRAVMIGLMVGSGSFLVLHWGLRLGVDPSLIAATFFGITVGLLLLQQVDKT